MNKVVYEKQFELVWVDLSTKSVQIDKDILNIYSWLHSRGAEEPSNAEGMIKRIKTKG